MSKLAPPYRYRLSWSMEVEDPGLTPDELEARGLCGSDAGIHVSFMYPADGSLSVAFVFLDGRTGGELADAEVFKAWAMLAQRLAESTTLGAGQRELCQAAFNVVREAILAGRHG